MSLRWRKSLITVGRSLGLDVLVLASAHWSQHVAWGRMHRLLTIMLVLNVAVVAYAWWWFGDPHREERIRALRREREERARLK